MQKSVNKIVIYTDGSSSLKSGYCGWGAIARFNGQEIKACGWAKGTNIFAELYAIIYALRKVPKNMPVTVITDSEYSINALTVWRGKWEKNGFKNIKNEVVAYSELVKEGHALVDSFSDLEFVHVRGHTGNEGNELADQLAKSARFTAEGRGEPLGVVVMENGLDTDTGTTYSR